MNRPALIPIEDSGFPFVWLDGDDMPKVPTKCIYKIYNDGSHYVATVAAPYRERKPYSRERNTQDYDMLFRNLYANARRFGYTHNEMTEYIKENMLKLFPDFENIDEYISKHIKMSLHNLWARKKRFRRKGYLNKWNYFVTFTYDDSKHTAETFRRKIRKCLSNLHTRRGWRYMGVFEEAPETGRLHFHGLFYVPDGEMIGKISEQRDYSTAQGRIQITNSNTFFAESFGRNDFSQLTDSQLKHGNTLEYILKYIGKTDERVVYSRGVPTEVCKELPDTEIITSYIDYVEKYVLFDDVISFESDILHYTNYTQISFIDVICNPPRAV